MRTTAEQLSAFTKELLQHIDDGSDVGKAVDLTHEKFQRHAEQRDALNAAYLPALADISVTIADGDLPEGESLATALSRHPDIFPHWYANIAMAGGFTSRVAISLESILRHLYLHPQSADIVSQANMPLDERHLKAWYHLCGTLLEIGVPLLDCFELAGLANACGQVRDASLRIKGRLTLGKGIGESMEEDSGIFPKADRLAIANSEEDGSVHEVLLKLGGD